MAQHPLVCEPPLISSVKLSQIRLSPPEVVFGTKHSPFCSQQSKSKIDESNTNRSSVLKTGQTEMPATHVFPAVRHKKNGICFTGAHLAGSDIPLRTPPAKKVLFCARFCAADEMSSAPEGLRSAGFSYPTCHWSQPGSYSNDW